MSSYPGMTKPPKQFVAEALLPDYPPVIPLRKAHWAGLAFDRNLRSGFAPPEIWDALLHVHAASFSEIAVISAGDLELEKIPIFVRADQEALMSYLRYDFRFTSDHFVFSPGQNWLCRLDQDVTLISGETQFMRKVVAHYGGLESIMDIMMDDFDPGLTDSVGLRRYLIGLTQEIPDGA
ncbi:hypothetical protein VDG09_20445 [Xanthomonas campestris pv. raphani]|uniref:hypothetical protein n=2 Tax=Xanthomonas campestris TaxID=339 RepID=UPI0023EA4BFB|nr:hypothetical protein [Xanthomonas campestris]MEA9829985.1 hypothetical protein [Xanthomonas campestris pv. raphani]